MSTKNIELARMKMLAGILAESSPTKIKLERFYMGVTAYKSPDEAAEDILACGEMISECQSFVNSKAMTKRAAEIDDAKDTNAVKVLKDMNTALNRLEELHAELFDIFDRG